MLWKWPKGRQFVKGQRPANWRPVGSENRTDRGIMVKIKEPDKWRLKHLVVWEKAYGPLPKGSRLAFRDGDKLNCSLDNLQLIVHRGRERWRLDNLVALPIKKDLYALSDTCSALRSALMLRLAVCLGTTPKDHQEGI